MTWHIDFTSRARSDLVGLDADIAGEVEDRLVEWVMGGPPRVNRRQLGDFEFYEEDIAGRYLLAYAVRSEPPSFVVLWLRLRPQASS